MKKPQVEIKVIPPEVMERIDRMEPEPEKYYGIGYTYKYILYPEAGDRLLILTWYEVEAAKNEQDYGAKYITYIDVQKEDWLTYEIHTQKWRRATVENLAYCNWRSVNMVHPERIEQYELFQGGESVVEAVVQWQQSVRKRQLGARQEKRDALTNRIMEQAEPLTEAFLEWQENTVMKDSRYLIYQRGGGKNFRAFCTYCKSNAEISRQECRHNKKGRCPLCGSRITMKSAGRTKHLIDDTWTEKVQAAGNGLLIRFIHMVKDYTDYGNPRRIVEEPCRVVIERGKKAVWYEKRESHTAFNSHAEYQRNKTEGCVHGINFPKTSKFRLVYRKGLKGELKKAFPYHTFWEWLDRNKKKIGQYTIYEFFNAYSCFPLLESLEKTGKTELVDRLVDGLRTYGKKYDRKATTVSGMLGISRKQYRELDNPSASDIEICKAVNRHGIVIDEIGLYQLKRYVNGYDAEEKLDTVLKYTSYKQFMGYAGRTDKYKIRIFYFDYLKMGERLGYDFKSKFVLFPRDPEQAHDTALKLIQEKKQAEELADAVKKDKGIMKVERKIRKSFSYEDDTFLIRPAKTNREIVREGQIQHICVGYAGFSEKMEKEKSYILFLRRKSKPDEPYYTVEITPEFEILQRHGKYNKEHEEVVSVDAFLKKFVEVKGNGKEYHAAK